MQVPHIMNDKISSTTDFSTNYTLREVMIHKSAIVDKGYDWRLIPIFNMYDNQEFIVAWKLSYISYSPINSKHKNSRPKIITNNVIQANILSNDSAIFKTKGSKYYHVDNINKHFSSTQWNHQDLNLKQLLFHNQLVSYALPQDILNINKYIDQINSPISYITCVVYKIINYDPHEQEIQDHETHLKNIFKT